MREKSTQTIKLFCWTTNTKIALHNIKYYLSKACFNFTTTTFTAQDPVRELQLPLSPPTYVYQLTAWFKTWHDSVVDNCIMTTSSMVSSSWFFPCPLPPTNDTHCQGGDLWYSLIVCFYPIFYIIVFISDGVLKTCYCYIEPFNSLRPCTFYPCTVAPISSCQQPPLIESLDRPKAQNVRNNIGQSLLWLENDM